MIICSVCDQSKPYYHGRRCRECVLAKYKVYDLKRKHNIQAELVETAMTHVVMVICKTCKTKKPYWKGRLCHGCYKKYAVKWRKKNNARLRQRRLKKEAFARRPGYHTTMWYYAKGWLKHKIWPGDMEKIEAVYLKSREMSSQTGIKYSVDHIIPIRGDGSVCGLHVSWNLDIKTLEANQRKQSHYDREIQAVR